MYFTRLNIANMVVEVCVDSLRSARIAENAGADRLELCAVLGLGGISPSPALVEQVVNQVSIPVHVLLRPRGGDFCYLDDEFEIMLRDIALCREMGVSGIVTGMLDREYRVDEDRVARIREASNGLAFTFHRAIDWVPDPIAACLLLDDMGVDYVLSSGQAKTAEEGLSRLTEMKASLQQAELIPAAGIRSHNAQLFREAGFTQLHLSGVRSFSNTAAPPFSLYSPELLEEGCCTEADEAEIRKLIETVK